MGRLGIIAGGIVFLVSLIIFAANQLFEARWAVVVGSMVAMIVGFCVMWYSIPKKKRFGDLETPWASDKYRKYYGVFAMALGVFWLGSWAYFGAYWPDVRPLYAAVSFGIGGIVLAWDYLKHRQRGA